MSFPPDWTPSGSACKCDNAYGQIAGQLYEGTQQSSGDQVLLRQVISDLTLQQERIANAAEAQVVVLEAIGEAIVDSTDAMTNGFIINGIISDAKVFSDVEGYTNRSGLNLAVALKALVVRLGGNP